MNMIGRRGQYPEVPPTDVMLANRAELALGIPTEKFTEIDDVRLNFAANGRLLQVAGYDQAVPFNNTYGRLTELVHAGIVQSKAYVAANNEQKAQMVAAGFNTKHLFTAPDTAENAVPSFYKRWTDPVRASALGQRALVSTPWDFALHNRRVKHVRPGIQFLIYMNVHINDDLAKTLRDTKAPEAYYGDYTDQVGRMIGQVAEEFAEDYIPGPSMIRKVLAAGAEEIIADWREYAWVNGQRLLILGERDPVLRDQILAGIQQRTMKVNHALVHGGGPAIEALGLSHRAGRELMRLASKQV